MKYIVRRCGDGPKCTCVVPHAHHNMMHEHEHIEGHPYRDPLPEVPRNSGHLRRLLEYSIQHEKARMKARNE